jgi:lipopolysaccharide export system permease protein
MNMLPVLQITLGIISVIFIYFWIRSKIFERYFFYETLMPFFTCLLVITFAMMLDRIMDLMNIIIEKQLDIVTIISLFAFSIPFIFALSVPMSVLMSTIMTFGRMSVDRELTATKSTGVNVYRMTRLLITFFLLVTVGMAYFNDFILPETNHILKNLLIKVTYKKPITAITPGTFTTLGSLTIYAKDRDDEALYDLLIFNLENQRFPQTVQARRGEIYLDPNTDQLKVILFDGEMYERDATSGEKFNISLFEKYTFFRSNLGYDIDDSGTDMRGNREVTSVQIQALIENQLRSLEVIEQEIENFHRFYQDFYTESEDMDPMIRRDELRRYDNSISMRQAQKNELLRQIRIYHVEIHKKYSLAVACFIFLLVGIPIGMMTRTSGVGVAFSFSSIIFIIYYVMLVLGEEFGSKGVIDPAFSMWLPCILFAIVACILIYFSLKEKQFDIMILWQGVKKIRTVFNKKTCETPR